MNTIDLVKQTFETQMRKPIVSIDPVDNVPNNSVYRIETESGPYIFKTYSGDWPEDGKLPYVSHRLDEHHIPHAEICVYRKDSDAFPHGYLIEECLPGTTAERMMLSKAQTTALFENLAALVSRIHRIQMTGYGYIGNGTAEWTSFSEFMGDSLHDNIAGLKERSMISETELETIDSGLRRRLACCDSCPSVLIHGDLSLKNVLVSGDRLTLIDWDDSYALCWMADIAYLTLWMKREYGKDAGHYRDAFLRRYETEQDMNLFYQTEDAIHVRYGLDHLSFMTANANYRDSIEITKAILRESFDKCGMAAPHSLM